MELTRVILDFVAALAWPLVVFAILFVFRNEIRKKINETEQLRTPGGYEAKFLNQQVKEAARRVESAAARTDLPEEKRHHVYEAIVRKAMQTVIEAASASRPGQTSPNDFLREGEDEDPFVLLAEGVGYAELSPEQQEMVDARGEGQFIQEGIDKMRGR